MPDRDWYYHNVPQNWRGVARRIEEGAGLARVGDLALRAVTRTLREAGGVAGLDDMIGVVVEYGVGGMTIPEAFSLLRQAGQVADKSGLTQVAKQAAESIIVAIDRGELEHDFAHAVRCRFIEQLLESSLFGRARTRWIPRRFPTFQDAHDWQRQCIASMQPRIAQLADGMERHPSGSGLRAPSRVGPREKTADLLFQPVGR